tara:strand:+ start:1820 stop:3574 length:1755 start_codon:yes stop_codon:yes gene_type:complete
MSNTTFTSGELVTATKLNTVNPSIISTDSTVARTLATRAADVMQVDDFIDVQAGLNYIVANGGVLEFTKAKSYTITAPLTAVLNSTVKELRWEIRGNGATLDCSSFTGSQVGLTIGGSAQANLNEKGFYSISGLRILGPEATVPLNFSATTTMVGLFIYYAIRVNLTNVECTRCYTGIKTAFVFPLTATNCSVENNYIGLHLDDVSNLHKWNQLSAKQCWYSVIIIKSDNYSTAKIAGVNFEGLWTEGSKVGVVVDPGSNSARSIRSLRFANGFHKTMEYDAFRFGREWTFGTPETRGADRAGSVLDVEIEGGDFPGTPADANTGTFVFTTPNPNCFGFFGHASVDIDDPLAWVNEPSMGEFLATGDEALGTVSDFKKRFWNNSVRESPVLTPATATGPVWVSGTSYSALDFVSYKGRTYQAAVSIGSSTTTPLDSTVAYWRECEPYVTGDWTPVVAFATAGNQNIAYTHTYGTYTKIGRLVTLQFDVETSTFIHSTASGALRINNLPYIPRAMDGQVYRPVGTTSVANITGFTDLNCVGNESSSVMNFIKGQTSATAGLIQASDCPSGNDLILHGAIQYETSV